MIDWNDITNLVNLPAYANKYNYVVAHYVKGKLWFYGAYETEERAREVAELEGGVALGR